MKLFALLFLVLSLTGCEIYWIPLGGSNDTTIPAYAAKPFKAAWGWVKPEPKIITVKEPCATCPFFLQVYLDYEREQLRLSMLMDEAFQNVVDSPNEKTRKYWGDEYFRIMNQRTRLQDEYVFGTKGTAQ